MLMQVAGRPSSSLLGQFALTGLLMVGINLQVRLAEENFASMDELHSGYLGQCEGARSRSSGAGLPGHRHNQAHLPTSCRWRQYRASPLSYAAGKLFVFYGPRTDSGLALLHGP